MVKINADSEMSSRKVMQYLPSYYTFIKRIQKEYNAKQLDIHKIPQNCILFLFFEHPLTECKFAGNALLDELGLNVREVFPCHGLLSNQKSSKVSSKFFSWK